MWRRLQVTFAGAALLLENIYDQCDNNLLLNSWAESQHFLRKFIEKLFLIAISVIIFYN